MLNLILILVAAVFAILTGVALCGAGAFVVASLGRWRKARKAAHHGAVLDLFAEIAQRGGLMPLSEGDRALIELGFEPTYRPGDRILLASGRIVTGWELAQLAPDLVTVEQSGDVDDFMAEELARCPKFREAYTALAPDDLMVVAEQVDVDPKPTYGQELAYDADSLVQYGTAMVHTRCRDARRDAATDHICEPCGQVFGRVTA